MGSLGKLSRSISGRVAIVTGAASGMGRATAHLFSDEGASVAVCDRNSEGVNDVVNEITDAGGLALGYVVDLDDLETIFNCDLITIHTPFTTEGMQDRKSVV